MFLLSQNTIIINSTSKNGTNSSKLCLVRLFSACAFFFCTVTHENIRRFIDFSDIRPNWIKLYIFFFLMKNGISICFQGKKKENLTKSSCTSRKLNALYMAMILNSVLQYLLVYAKNLLQQIYDGICRFRRTFELPKPRMRFEYFHFKCQFSTLKLFAWWMKLVGHTIYIGSAIVNCYYRPPTRNLFQFKISIFRLFSFRFFYYLSHNSASYSYFNRSDF